MHAGCFPVLVTLLSAADEDTAAEAAWALAFLTAREDACVVALLQHQLVPALMQLLLRGNGRTTVCTPVLRALGNLAAGPDEWVVELLKQAQFLPCLAAIVTSQDAEHHALVKEAAWAVANIAGGHPNCRDAVVAAGFMTPLLDLLRSGQFDIQVSIICNDFILVR
jgi:Armadillo/beta-catenin-like repeat